MLVHRDNRVETVLQDPVMHLLQTNPAHANALVGLGAEQVTTPLGELSAPLWGHAGDQSLIVGGTFRDIQSLERGQRYLATPLRTGEFLVLQEPSTEDTRLVLAHTAHRLGAAVDIGAVTRNGFTPALVDLSYGTSTRQAGIAVAPGNYRIGVALVGTTQLLTDVRVDVEPDSRSFFLVVDGGRMVRVRTDDGVWTMDDYR